MRRAPASTGVAVGAHMLTVYPADGEGVYSREWTVPPRRPPPPPAPPAAPAVPAAPKRPTRTATASRTRGWSTASGCRAGPRQRPSVTGDVKLTLGKATKEAKKVRVFRANGRRSTSSSRRSSRRPRDRQEAQARQEVQLQDGRRQRQGPAGRGVQAVEGQGQEGPEGRPQEAVGPCRSPRPLGSSGRGDTGPDASVEAELVGHAQTVPTRTSDLIARRSSIAA